MAKRFSKSSVSTLNSDMYAPWVPETSKAALKKSPYYLPFLKMYSKTKLKCVEILQLKPSHLNDVEPKPVSGIILGYDNNFRVAKLTGIGHYHAYSFDAPDASPNTGSLLGSSDKLMYLVNRMINPSTSPGHQLCNAIDRVATFVDELASDFGNTVAVQLRNEHPNTFSAMSTLGNEGAMWLLKHYANEINEADIPSNVRNLIDKSIKGMYGKDENNKIAGQRLLEFFDCEKWMFGYREEVGYYLGAANFKETYDNYLHRDQQWAVGPNVRGASVTEPIAYYKTFSSIPEHLRNSLMASVAMVKMYIEGTSNQYEYYDPERLIPKATIVMIDAGAKSGLVHGGGGYWLLMDRV